MHIGKPKILQTLLCKVGFHSYNRSILTIKQPDYSIYCLTCKHCNNTIVVRWQINCKNNLSTRLHQKYSLLMEKLKMLSKAEHKEFSDLLYDFKKTDPYSSFIQLFYRLQSIYDPSRVYPLSDRKIYEYLKKYTKRRKS